MPRTAQGSEKRTLVTRAIRYLGAWKEVPDMHVVLIPNYLFGLAGLVAGGAVGLLVAAVANNGRLPARDAR